MIDDKKIEEIAKDCANNAMDDMVLSIMDVSNSNLGIDDYFVIACKDAIHKAIQEFLKELWHDGCELPKRNTGTAIVIYNNGTMQSVFVTYLYSIIKDYGKHSHIKCWCYLNDLFERQKGGSNERI